MKCEEVEKVVIDYLDNTLGQDLHREIEKHLETCERCLDEFRYSQKIMQLISEDEMEKPDDSLRINFYHMLHKEIKKKDSLNYESVRKPSVPWYSKSYYRIAAGIALLIGGTFTGMIIRTTTVNSYDKNEIAQLHSEVTNLKQTVMFSMLKEESSSGRIQAVNFVNDLEKPNEQVIEVLVNTLNHDKNVNVRLAAAYALARFADQRSVCDSLVKSLSVQDDPILQVTLINILVELREKSALEPIKQIITNKNTLREVKAVAESGVSILL